MTMSPGNPLPDQESVDEPIAEEPELALDEDDTYFPTEPPIDPPIVPGGRDNAEIPGATEDGDLDSVPRRLGDAEITAAVRRLLRMDASTSTLSLVVHTHRGVVTLYGTVQSLDDADNATSVAAQAPGVLEVVDAMDVQ